MTLRIDDLSPVHRRMVLLLKDGLPHSKQELHGCLDDELASPKAVINRLCELRKILRVEGIDVVCRALGGRSYYRYQMVRIIGGTDE